MSIHLELEMRREQVAACRKMCRERFALKGDFTGWLMQAFAYHACVGLLHEAEAQLRATEKRIATTTNGAHA